MKQVIPIQHPFCSIQDTQYLCSLDNEIISEKTPPLIHQSARILFVRSGKGMLRIQGQEYPLAEGTVAMIFPWEITQVTAVEQILSYTIVKYNHFVLQFFIKTQLPAETERNSLLEQLEQQHVFQFAGQGWSQILLLLKLLEEETGMEAITISRSYKSYSNTFCCNILVELAVLLYRSGQTEISSCNASHEKIELLRYMYLHLESQITVQMLSRIFYISQSSIRRHIRSMTGLSFNELLNSMRTAKISNYLLYTDLTLEELAELFGFVDTSHIWKVFQARVGMKVKEYRKTYQNVQQLCRVHETRTDYAIVNFIYRNYSQELKTQKVAEQFHVTPQELNQMLLYQVGKTFPDFLNKVRIDHACRLLLESNFSIADIALQVGYSNVKTFHRNFVSSKLMTPSVFRQTVHMLIDAEPNG